MSASSESRIPVGRWLLLLGGVGMLLLAVFGAHGWDRWGEVIMGVSFTATFFLTLKGGTERSSSRS